MKKNNMRKSNLISEYVDNIAQKEQDENEAWANKLNDASCDVCGSNQFVQKFRNVVGEISGSMQGNYSLFGGSISGSINGYTKTLPVLSCRKCENEREIEVWEYIYGEDIFWKKMHYFYFGISKNNKKYLDKIDSFFLDKPVETRQYIIDNPNLNYSFYNDIVDWETSVWAKAGFNIPKKKHKFLFWEEEIYPTWQELEQDNQFN